MGGIRSEENERKFVTGSGCSACVCVACLCCGEMSECCGAEVVVVVSCVGVLHAGAGGGCDGGIVAVR